MPVAPSVQRPSPTPLCDSTERTLSSSHNQVQPTASDIPCQGQNQRRLRLDSAMLYRPFNDRVTEYGGSLMSMTLIDFGQLLVAGSWPDSQWLLSLKNNKGSGVPLSGSTDDWHNEAIYQIHWTRKVPVNLQLLHVRTHYPICSRTQPVCGLGDSHEARLNRN